MIFRHCARVIYSLRSYSTKPVRTMKLSDEQMSYVLRPSVVTLANMFKKYNYDIRVAGGAVRDLLQGLQPHDLDFATTATPDQMKEMFGAEEVRLISAKGEKHGTITARLEEENFECTTLRVDISTDGRWAEVQFTTDWYLDANRRDLTINSMFLGLDGTVYDYFNGIEHLKERKIEFVGDPDKRIQEDYLRILRYFRFYGRIAPNAESHNPLILESIKRNVDGLSRISGERIWSELTKILVGNYGGEMMKKMAECAITQVIGLPRDFNGDKCVQLWDQCNACDIDPHSLSPMTLIAAGLNEEDEAYEFITRVKCSKKEREVLVFIMQNKDKVTEETSIKDLQDMLVDSLVKMNIPLQVATAQMNELLKFKCFKSMLDDMKDWTVPRFPVKGGMIVNKLKNKRRTKEVFLQLVDKWKESNFSNTQEELISYADEVVKTLEAS